MRVRTVMVSLAAILLSVPMALVAPSAAFAGGRPLVDPSTLHPVPHPGGQPVCAREGNFIQCHTTIPQSFDFGPVDSGITCGDVMLQQTLTWTFSGVSIYNAQGYVLKLIYVDSYTGSFSNPVTGKSVAWTQQDRATSVFTTPGDDSAGTMTLTEHQRVYGPTGRVILTDDGTEVLDLTDYTRLKAAGHHPLDDALYDGITTGLAPLCDALA